MKESFPFTNFNRFAAFTFTSILPLLARLKYLGILFDNKIPWSMHFGLLTQKLRKADYFKIN